MIRLSRGGLVPTTRLRDDQDALRGVSDEQALTVVSDRGSRGWLSMRPALDAAQHHKCGYCEDDLTERATEVDHIRPKSPGKYWWLAFSVRNLVLTCRSCNNFKSSRWDLQPGTRRLVPREEPWTTSEPAMFVDPTVEEPSDHLTYVFAGGRWRVAALTARGRRTIEILTLDRDSFTRRANEWIREAIDPRVSSYALALSNGDVVEATRVIRELAAFAAPEHRWAHLSAILLEAIRNGDYESPVL